MSGEWREVCFIGCAERVSDVVQPGLVAPSTPYVGLEHIVESELYLNGHSYAENATSTKLRFNKGDVLFGKLRPYFRKVVRPAFDGVCSTDIWVVRARHGVDQAFLLYLMASDEFIEKATEGSTGTRMPRADWDYLSTHMVLLPPLPEQRRIAKILGDLDDKIELNRKMNETLEQMARALFKSWFIDFDPVRAKMEGRQPPGMDADTAALFPSRLVESELGLIPEGWEVGSVRDSFNLTMGQSPPGDTYNETGQGIAFYQGRSEFGFRFPRRRVFCTAPTRFAEPGDTLVSVRAPVGDINMANELCCIGRGLAAVRHTSGAKSYTYHAMASLYPEFAAYEAEGTVFGSINKQNFENLRCVMPPKRIVEAYEDLASQLDDQIQNFEQQSRSLASLRDTLLPQLMRGDGGLILNE